MPSGGGGESVAGASQAALTSGTLTRAVPSCGFSGVAEARAVFVFGSGVAPFDVSVASDGCDALVAASVGVESVECAAEKLELVTTAAAADADAARVELLDADLPRRPGCAS